MKTIPIASGLAIACLAGLVGAAPAGAAFPGENGVIAFASDRQGTDFDIWTMDPYGTGLVNLTAKSRADEFGPNWRANGRKIAFNSNRVSVTNPEGDHEIFVMDADGSNVTQITFNALDDEDPAWSPGGRRIVFQRDFNPVEGELDHDVFTMNADGTGQQNLTNSLGIEDQQANWSPLGTSVVFLSDRDGDLEVYTMDPDGSDVHQRTFNDASEFVPSWSPDGSRIVFTSDRDANFEIYTMGGDGSDPTRLTFNDAGDGYPAWAPDGTAIVFASDRAGARGGFSDLYTMRTDGSDQIKRTSTPATDVHPDWQPTR